MSIAYICDGIRTPFGRYGGQLAKVRADDLAAIPLKTLLQRNPHIDPEAIDDVLLGCANQAGEDNRNVARMAALLAGLPVSVTGSTINRLCGSSLDAIAVAARAIKSGEAQLIIAGGVESMSRAPFVMAKTEQPFSRTAQLEDTTLGWRLINPLMRQRYGVDSMPETAENVAEKFGIGRVEQDAFAWRSQQRTQSAFQQGVFTQEIMPVSIPQRKGDPVTVTDDEHPRADTTLEKLAALKPIVRDEGSITAGNASGVNDGAAALIIASEQAVKTFNLTPRAKILASAVAGVEPRIMGIGPVPATRKLLNHLKLSINDFDLIEINEAFAAQVLAVMQELEVDQQSEQVNPNGGAIALGHPLGASGARIVLSAVNQLHRSNAKRALCTMCIGVGQGIAMAIEIV